MGCAASSPQHGSGPETVTSSPDAAVQAAKGKVLPKDAEENGLIKAKEASLPAQVGAGEKARSKKSRARRLSYVDHRDETEHNKKGQKAAEEDDDEEEEEEQVAVVESAAKERSKGARRRRLSYVVDEKDPKMKAKLALEQAKAERKAANCVKPAEEFTAEEASIKAMLDKVAGAPSKEKVAVAAPKSMPAGNAKGKVSLSTACISRAGREPGFKKQNQDNCFAFEKYMQDGHALFGAFDGHGPEGHTISGYVKQHLPVLLVNSLKTANADAPVALKNCFLEVDKAMNATKIDCEFSGSTACVAFLTGRQLNVAWVGDSRGVMGRKGAGGYEAYPMTTDHKPTDQAEQARIIASSGRVERLVDEGGEPIGPFRVWLQYAWIPGLAMSRALGDALAHQVGVTSEPEVFSHVLTEKDAFIVLASDGVWEFIDSQAAVTIIGNAATAEEGCRQLVDEAFQRWLVEEEGVVDDITAVVVRFSYTD